jgi:CRISPR/Cas system-associated protein Cas5 (RAMP superfamily)
MRRLYSKHPLVLEYQSLLEKINKEFKGNKKLSDQWDRVKHFYGDRDGIFIMDKMIQYLDKMNYPPFFEKLPDIGESLFFVESFTGAYEHRSGAIEFTDELTESIFIKDQIEDWADDEKEVRENYDFWVINHQMEGSLENHLDYIRKEYEDGATFIVHLSSLEENFKFTLIK